MDGNLLLLLWAVSGALIGALFTPMILRRRGYDTGTSALLGLVMGGIANLLVLIPMWVLLPPRAGAPDPLSPEFTVKIESLSLEEAALKYPDTHVRYTVVDAVSEAVVLHTTTFQLEYLKARMIAPRRESEGWYVLRRLLPLMLLDAQSLDEESAARLADLEAQAREPSGETTLPINKLEQDALILKRKAHEITLLHDALLAALDQDDAFEVEWRDYDGPEERDTVPL